MKRLVSEGCVAVMVAVHVQRIGRKVGAACREERSEPFCFDNRNFAESLAKVDGTLTRTETHASHVFPAMPCKKFALAWL